MKISLKSEKVYQGGIYQGLFIMEEEAEINFDYITCSIKCDISTPGTKIVVLDSVHKILEFKNNVAILKFTIPKEAPPTLSDVKHQIRYRIYLYIYNGLEKKVMKFPFTVGSSYIYNASLLYKLRIDNDMMRTNHLMNTPFQTVVNKIRKIDTKINKDLPLLDIIKERVDLLKKVDLSMEISRTDQNGDIWFYSDNNVLSVENKEIPVDIHYEDEIFATVHHFKYVKREIDLRISFYKDVQELRVDLVKKINEELDTPFFLNSFSLKDCLYRVFKIEIPINFPFSFKSNFFEIEYNLLIHIDEISFNIPIVLIDTESNIDLFSD